MNLLTLLFLACAPKAAAPALPSAAAPEAPTVEAPTEQAAPTSNQLPTPFTADQIRAAMPVGTFLRFRLEAEGQAPAEQRWLVTSADAETCTISSALHDPVTGAVLMDQGAQTSAWTELRDHAAFPAGLTTQSTDEIDLPAGHFSVVGYHVRQPDGPMSHYWFSPTLPGPPVLISVVTPSGTELMRLTLIERSTR